MSGQFARTHVNAWGEDWVVIRPIKPFVVDGITYWLDPTRDASVGCVRPMITLVLDDDPFDDDEDRSQMFHSDPPTEEELDNYVRFRLLPPT